MDILGILGELQPQEARWLEASLPVVLRDAVAKAKENERAFEEITRKWYSLSSRSSLPAEDGTAGNQPTDSAFSGEAFRIGNSEGK